jgi:NAD(P)-dependent dehydrogenase (short-subunit alcohol dehydrogenase family)
MGSYNNPQGIERVMSEHFGAKSTTDDVLAGVDLSGKRVLVTGVSAGLGVETARVLAAHGADVVGAARDLQKAEGATAVVREAAATSGGSLALIELDLADLASVRAAADALVKDAKEGGGRGFDLVIANAGVMAPPFGKTKDGFETQFGTNHLGHFVFVNRIASLLKAGSRVVSLASAGHRFSDVNLEDPNFETTEYTPFGAYGRSKTANVLFAVEFDRRHKARGVRATAVHPGGIQTELSRHMDPAFIQQWLDQLNAEAAAQGQPPIQMKTIPQGAATSVWAGVVAPAEAVGGRYCEDCQVAELTENDSLLRAGVRPYALDPARAQALWALSEAMVGETF